MTQSYLSLFDTALDEKGLTFWLCWKEMFWSKITTLCLTPQWRRRGGVGGHFDTPGYRREGQKGNKRTKTRDRQRDMTHKGLLSQPVLTKIFGVEGNLCTITCIKHCQRHNRPKGWIFSSKWLRVLSWYHNFSSGSKSRPNFSLKKLTTIWLQHLNQTLAPMFGLCFNFKIMTKFQSQSLT